MNRIHDLYELAVRFNALPSMVKYVIGSTFRITKYEDFVLNEDEISDSIFEHAVKKHYKEFRTKIRDYKPNGID